MWRNRIWKMSFCQLQEERMSKNRLKTVLLHTWYHFLHSVETWVDVFWQPAIQIWVYTLIALSFASVGDTRGANIMMGMIFWNFIWVGEYAITVGALWEVWSKSFSSLFITPLSMQEFILGQMVSGTIKSFLAVVMSSIIAYLLYHFSIFSLGWMTIIYTIELLVFSWALGVMILGLIFRFGMQIQSLSWALIFLIQPVGAVFYPVSVLPAGIRWIAYSMPSTYVFETMRRQYAYGVVDWPALGIASLLNVVWFVAGWIIFQLVYQAVKRSGAFARLEG